MHRPKRPKRLSILYAAQHWPQHGFGQSLAQLCRSEWAISEQVQTIAGAINLTETKLQSIKVNRWMCSTVHRLTDATIDC